MSLLSLHRKKERSKLFRRARARKNCQSSTSKVAFITPKAVVVKTATPKFRLIKMTTTISKIESFVSEKTPLKSQFLTKITSTDRSAHRLSAKRS